VLPEIQVFNRQQIRLAFGIHFLLRNAGPSLILDQEEFDQKVQTSEAAQQAVYTMRGGLRILSLGMCGLVFLHFRFIDLN
jgi:hypothetical protein